MFRRFQHIVLIILFMLTFISGYHDLLGLVIGVVSIPVQFFMTTLWKYTILFDDEEETKGLVNEDEPRKFGDTGFSKFDNEG